MKIVLLGNAGAGKSTLAKQLIGDREIALLALDNIAWQPDVQRKPLDESITLLEAFIHEHKQWIIEGCYGDLVEAALPYCDELRFLNPGIAVCVAHCRQRPWESDKFASPEEQDAMLHGLIDWVKDYASRTDELGLQRHRQIFDRFTGKKQEYHTVADYDHANPIEEEVI
ncbi:MAG: shikimate kinase [Cyanobacteria bacterium P01_F01_bin.56]